MKRHLNFCHAGLISVAEFCKLDGLTYVGTLVYKETDEIALDLGEVVSINGNYFATNISFLPAMVKCSLMIMRTYKSNVGIHLSSCLNIGQNCRKRIR